MTEAGGRYAYLWAFQVVAGSEAQFELLYGPDGDWARFFRKGAGYLRTELLRDIDDPRRYVTVDSWVSREAFDTFRRAWAPEFEALDARGESLTESETPLGSFVVLSEA